MVVFLKSTLDLSGSFPFCFLPTDVSASFLFISDLSQSLWSSEGGVGTVEIKCWDLIFFLFLFIII